jgi:hypothetical protein
MKIVYMGRSCRSHSGLEIREDMASRPQSSAKFEANHRPVLGVKKIKVGEGQVQVSREVMAMWCMHAVGNVGHANQRMHVSLRITGAAGRSKLEVWVAKGNAGLS